MPRKKAAMPRKRRAKKTTAKTLPEPEKAKPSLITIPAEIQTMIANELNACDLLCLRMAGMRLHLAKTLPVLTMLDWVRFTRLYETSIRRKKNGQLLSLGCARCHKLHPPTAFTDGDLKKGFTNDRRCVECLIITSGRTLKTFQYQVVDNFGCAGCYKPKALEDEDMSGKHSRPWQLDLRWCKDCGPVLNNLVQVYTRKR